MSKIMEVMANCVERFDKWTSRLAIMRAKVCLNIASRIICLEQKLFDRMVAYATEIIEAEEGV